LSILSMLSAGGNAEPGPARLCQLCTDLIVMSGAGIVLMSGDVSAGAVGTTNAVSALIEELQYTLGEGPCVDAHDQQRPVLEPDLAGSPTTRWLAFTPPALEAGVRAVFAFPLRVGAVRLGALDLYRDQPGPLTDDQHADALVIADVAARAVLVLQAHAPPGALAADLEDGGSFRIVVHQAAGMVSVQLGVSVGEALIRLRAFAFANDCRLPDVANDVVSRRLRFEDGEADDGLRP
jgi:GAF domain